MRNLSLIYAVLAIAAVCFVFSRLRFFNLNPAANFTVATIRSIGSNLRNAINLNPATNFTVATTRSTGYNLRNAIEKIRARNAYLGTMNTECSEWKFRGTPAFHTVPVYSGATLSLLSPVYQCPWSLDRTNYVNIFRFDGGKWTCGLKNMQTTRASQRTPCIMYSFGSNNDDFFERHVLELSPSCEVHMFDPTNGHPPASWAGKYVFHKSGICAVKRTSFGTSPDISRGRRRYTSEERYPCANITRHMQNLGHDYIDILSMDVESEEWPIMETEDWRSLRVGQILIQCHFWGNRFPNSLPQLLRKQFIPMERGGFFLISIEPVSAAGMAYELVFLNVNWNPTTKFSSAPIFRPEHYPITPGIEIEETTVPIRHDSSFQRSPAFGRAGKCSFYKNQLLILPVFKNRSHLASEPEWEVYLGKVYGLETLAYPVDLRGFTLFWQMLGLPSTLRKAIKKQCVDFNVSFQSLSTFARRSNAMLPYGTIWANAFFKRHGTLTNYPIVWIHAYGTQNGTPGPFYRAHRGGLPGHTLVEVFHACCDACFTGFWFYLAPGSGIYYNLGKTISFRDSYEACMYFGGSLGICGNGNNEHLDRIRINAFIYQLASSAGFDSLQYYDMHNDSVPVFEIVDLRDQDSDPRCAKAKKDTPLPPVSQWFDMDVQNWSNHVPPQVGPSHRYFRRSPQSLGLHSCHSNRSILRCGWQASQTFLCDPRRWFFTCHNWEEGPAR